MEWASLDLYTTPPSVGVATKFEPTATLRNEGFHGNDKVGPGFVNHMLNRLALSQQFMAKMMAGNYSLKDSGNFPAGGEKLGVGVSMQSPTSGMTLSWLFYPSGGAGNIVERATWDGGAYFIPVASPVAAVAGAIAALDAESDGNIYRVCVASGPPLTDQIFYNNDFAATPWLGAGTGGAAKDWLSVGCDRNTAGGANPLWLIGDSGAGGTIAPVLYGNAAAATPAVFANVATFPVLAIGNQIDFIGHTNHPAGALGPNDSGNPSWLVLTTAPAGAGRSLVSADGATWSDQAHGLGAWQINKKSAAYSRTASRWVVVDTNGNTFYSDDNGVTWAAGVTIPLPAAPMVNPQIVCDGYGTFVIGEQTSRMWVSTDDGITWSRLEIPPTTGFTDSELCVAFDEGNDWNTPGDHPTWFAKAYQNTGVLFEAFHSLLY
jgi:hypothetical protein